MLPVELERLRVCTLWFSERYNLLLQRLMRINNVDTGTATFSLEGAPKASHGNIRSEAGGHEVITPVESLLGNPGEKLTFGLVPGCSVHSMYNTVERDLDIEML